MLENRSNSKRYNLQRHVKTHTGERPYKCNICPNRTFIQKSNYQSHMRVHASTNEVATTGGKASVLISKAAAGSSAQTRKGPGSRSKKLRSSKLTSKESARVEPIWKQLVAAASSQLGKHRTSRAITPSNQKLDDPTEET